MPTIAEPTLAVFAGSDVAANTEISEVVPAGQFWNLVSFTVALVQGITQTPQPILMIDEGLNTDGNLGTVTVTIASPGVFTRVAHGLIEGEQIFLKTTGALPTGLAVDTPYYIIAAGLTADAFQVSATRGGAAINTSGSQSGTHTLYRILIVFESFGATAAQSASTTCRYNWAQSLVISALVGATINVHATAPLPKGLILGPAYRIRTNTIGIGANSNFAAPIMSTVKYTAYPGQGF